MSNHTPGPWKVMIHPLTGPFVYCPENYIITGPVSQRSDGINADLIAAAPELFEALKWFMPFIESEEGDERQAEWVRKAREALAKAEGK